VTDYAKTCFVIMPFGTKTVGNRTIDFDRIYDQIFLPAAGAARLPEGGTLIPHRTDRDFFSGVISADMFEYLEYSRMAVADITGLNPNVFYELGVRHAVRASGTAIFRVANEPIPFDISHVKAFPYEYEPEDRIQAARDLVRRILEESLQENRIDSPVQVSLGHQRATAGIDDLLRRAEESIRMEDRASAIMHYEEAVRLDPNNALLRVRLGLMLKAADQWQDALTHFIRAISLQPDYADAWRERGIAEDKLFRKSGTPPDGSASLRRAIELNGRDFDALSSLGGVLKRNGAYAEALDAYSKAVTVSNGHSYPLLNAVKLEACIAGAWQPSPARLAQIRRLERPLYLQATSVPPYNAPWSCFDYAETQLYLGRPDAFIDFIQRGIDASTAGWMTQTAASSLRLLPDHGVDLPRLREGVEMLDAYAPIQS
jgi:tetratricopeptide (TPR) repeat protein